MSICLQAYVRDFVKSAVIVFPVVLLPSSAIGTDFNADAVMNKMTPDERSSFIAGVVEGLAYSRFEKDDKKTDGMKCIYDWFYNSQSNDAKVDAAFLAFPTYTPGAIMAALLQKDCGP